VDDPIKSWEAAMSPRVRERTIEWWTGTMESRIEPGGAVILICARWHEDDLSGFLLREAPDEWTELRLPAICDDPDSDPLDRQLGEALWPERYPLDDLERRHRATSLALGEQVWLAQFQQTPKTPAGGLFPDGKWSWVAGRLDCRRWVRAWDLAATTGGGDWTAGVLIGELADGRWLIADVVRGQWSPDEVRARIRGCADRDPAGTVVELPQDPGQAGKDQAQQLIRMLAGRDVRARPQTGSKEVRAAGLSAQQRAGNVVLVEGLPWVGAFVAELNGFPKGAHDDQVDAAATGFNALAGTPQLREQSYRNEALTGSR
jgi:predicted phage terminase large subunit-like protein